MAFVAHVQKASRKGGSTRTGKKIINIGDLYRHNERLGGYGTAENIDKDKTASNYSLDDFDKNKSYDKRLDEIKAEYGITAKERSAAVASFVISASNDEMKNMTPEQQKNYFKDVKQELDEHFGADTNVYAQVHNDEETPHMHIGYVPIYENDKGNNAIRWGDIKKDKATGEKIYSGKIHKDFLKYLQNDLPQHLIEKGYPIELGKKQGKEHVDTEVWREAQAKADKLVKDAEEKAKKITEDAERKAIDVEKREHIARNENARSKVAYDRLQNVLSIPENKMKDFKETGNVKSVQLFVDGTINKIAQKKLTKKEVGSMAIAQYKLNEYSMGENQQLVSAFGNQQLTVNEHKAIAMGFSECSKRIEPKQYATDRTESAIKHATFKDMNNAVDSEIEKAGFVEYAKEQVKKFKERVKKFKEQKEKQKTPVAKQKPVIEKQRNNELER